ncbi:MAG: LacI family DNA-binding transcriptional regulator [Suipraeoptans sp.]
MAATMKDLAKETGLGLATISSYFNGGNVREQNKEKIESAVRKLNFEINEVARGLKMDHTNMIGVVIPELNSIFCAEIITEIEDVLRSYGYATIICDCRTDENREREAVDFLLHKRVDGLIIMPTATSKEVIRKFIQNEKPIVLVDRMLADVSCDSILVDNEKAVNESVKQLIELGHHEIGIISGPKGIYTSEERLAGYAKALTSYGIKLKKRLIADGEFTISGGSNAMDKLIMDNKNMTAVIVTNYEMTVGAMISINERNISIPEELSVIGYDNEEFARATNPRLSIISQPTKEIGESVARTLIRRINNKEANIKTIRLDTKFINGKSIRGGVYE